MQVDVTDEKSVRFLIDETKRSYGRLDNLINNAGIYPVLGSLRRGRATGTGRSM